MCFNNKVRNNYIENLIYGEVIEDDVTLEEQEEIIESEWFINWMKEYHY